MHTFVILSLGNGSIKNGFPSVTAQILAIGDRRPQKVKAVGSLPPFPPLVDLLNQWSEYYYVYNQTKFLRRINLEQDDRSLHFSQDDFNALSKDLVRQLNRWLSDGGFLGIDQQLRTNLSIKDHFQTVIESNDRQIWQLPWHLWNFVQDYKFTEVGIAALRSNQVSPTLITRKLSRVLAILGDSRGIDIDSDRRTLEGLLGSEIKFLVEPSRQEFNQALWDKLGWDILFFAGHSYSYSDANSGCIFLNRSDQLELSELSHGLKQAINNGLSLAIFNSCQGLGLASQLASLSIPHLIVMKEPVPDRVAQAFLKFFLEDFTREVPFSLCLRSARQKLQGMEQEFAYSSWLPVLYQNPCELPPSWSKLTKIDRTNPSILEQNFQVKLFNESQLVSTIPLNKDKIIIGRAEDCDIHLDRASVSRHHAAIEKVDNSYQIIDLDSRKGTLLNGIPLTANTPYKLKQHDTIEISRYLLEVIVTNPISEQIPKSQQTIEYQFDAEEKEDSIKLNFRHKSNLTIGRDPSNDVVIQHPAVSAFHGIISRFDGSIYVTDLNSRNGIFVNGKRIKTRKTLNYNDRLRIASYNLIFNRDETFTTIDEAGNIRIDAVNLCQVVQDQTVKQKRNLLNNISISIAPREFVIVAGVSGGGKSTLMNALSGFVPASSGKVYVNGIELYRNYDAYRNEIGYVPQQDIVHTELTVYQALNFAARLRMPGDTSITEREQRIVEVLSELRLLERKNTKILRLSGGQKKRVSIALELLTQPSLFFLDEATSGLDPATDREVMQILRHIADSGKTVLLITHATENVKIADIVLFLAKEGNLAYFGSPKEIQGYFAQVSGKPIDTFTDIYRLLEDVNIRTPEEWRNLFFHSSYYQKYVTQRQQEIDITSESSKIPSKKVATSHVSNTSSFSQFFILLERNFLLLFVDPVSTFLVIAIPPILGILDLLTWDRNIFDASLGNSGQAITMLFHMGLVPIIAGCLSTIREVIKEVDIYRRERATGLKVLPYILSKISFCIVLALYQSAILFAFKYVGVNLTGTLWQYYLILFFASLAGTVLGLFVSAISPNQNVAPLIAIVLLIPQITFGGGLLPVSSFGVPGRILNNMSLTKWSFESLVTVSGMGKDVATDVCWSLDKTDRDKLTEKQKKSDCNCLGENLFNKCQFPGILSNYDDETRNSIESTEPKQPTRPKSPGDLPSDPTQLSAYEEKVKNFNRELKTWEKGMDKWRSQFSDWKQKRESAIGGAEGIIGQMKDDYGQSFNVNIWRHLQIMVCQICFIVIIIFFLQKRKDVL